MPRVSPAQGEFLQKRTSASFFERGLDQRRDQQNAHGQRPAYPDYTERLLLEILKELQRLNDKIG